MNAVSLARSRRADARAKRRETALKIFFAGMWIPATRHVESSANRANHPSAIRFGTRLDDLATGMLKHENQLRERRGIRA